LVAVEARFYRLRASKFQGFKSQDFDERLKSNTNFETLKDLETLNLLLQPASESFAAFTNH
jgi:hypothetical protein